MKQTQLKSLERDWERLLKEGQELNFRKGQVLFYEGHDPYGLFVLRSGEVRFSRGEKGCGEPHFWSAPLGKVLGLNPFFDKRAYCCTCAAGQNCKVTFLSKTQLMPFFEA